MIKYAKKVKILGRIFLTVSIITTLSLFVGIFFYSQYPNSAAALILLSFYISATFYTIYFVKFFWFGHSFKLLKKNGLEHYLDDIDLTTPTFKHSMIYCGEKAFFCKKTGLVVPYDQCAWIYCTGGYHGGHFREYAIHIRLKNGIKAKVMISKDQEVLSLLNNYIIPKNPKLIEGKTVQAKQEYLRLYPESTRLIATGKIIGGAILSSFALLCIIVGLIKDTLEIENLIVVGILEAIGLGLLLFGFKGSWLTSWLASIQDQLSQLAIFDTLYKIGAVLAVVCLVLLCAAGVLDSKQLFYPALIGLFTGVLSFMGFLPLTTEFIVKDQPIFCVKLPDETLDDMSLITNVSFTRNDNLFTYAFHLIDDIGWNDIRELVDHLASVDLDREHFTLLIGDNNVYSNITKEYLMAKKTGKAPIEWTREYSSVKVIGKSKALKSFVEVVFYTNSQLLEASFSLENKRISTAYVETLIRRGFGTPDQLKLAKPFHLGEPVSIGEDHAIHLDTTAFARYLKTHPALPMYEFRGAVPLTEKEPIICLFEDDVKTREYRLQTEGDEDFTGKFFLISVRLGIHGNPTAPTAQIDGFISDTPEERNMSLNDIGYRMEGHFLSCGGENTVKRREMNRGQDLPMKGLKYPGYTTPSNVRLIGICPGCEKSFCFHGYAFYMGQSDVAYSDDGLDCCEIIAPDIDRENWTYETEGKIFRYYNSFNCPHCGAPYIDYKKYPENKRFGVSGCVLLGRKYYQYE